EFHHEFDKPLGLHSTFLIVGVGSGIPALAFLLWILVAIVRTLLQRLKATEDQWAKALITGVSLMVVGFSVRNVFAYMFAGSLAYLFWILVATGLAVEAKADK